MKIIIILITILRLDYIHMDCGFPALPQSTKINSYKERYEEYSHIEYECERKRQELVGDKKVRCINGRWIGNIPKCANKSKSKLKSLIIPDMSNGKPFYRFFGSSSAKDCYQPLFIWNITQSQRVSVQVESELRIDYFSLTLICKDLVQIWEKKDLVLTAKIQRPRKQCTITNMELIANSNKTKISFVCYPILEEIVLTDSHSFASKSDSLKMISFEIQSKYQFSVTFCSLITYTFRDSCGSPERPLHSIQLTKDDSFTVFSCEEDFYLEPIRSQKVVCGPSGNWNRKFPRCLAKSFCRLPAMDGSDPYIHVEYKNLNYLNGTPFAETNSIALYSCRSANDTQIRLSGDYRRVCVRGFWSGSQPKCSDIKSNNYLRKSNDFGRDRNYIKYSQYSNAPKSEESINQTAKESNGHRLHLVVISMLGSFAIGAAFIGFIIFLVMKYVVRRRRRTSNAQTIPSVVVSEPNHYYERNLYEEYRYESIRMNSLEVLELERINSLYQTNSN